MMCEKKCYAKKQELLCEKVGDTGIILFDEDNNETHLLNQSAMLIWELIDGKTDIGEIYKTYSNFINFDEISCDEVIKDFYEIINLLERKNIIREMKNE